MSTPCTVCTHPDRPAVEAALAAGASFRTVAEQYGLSATSLHRHQHEHVATPVPPPTPAATLAALQAERDDLPGALRHAHLAGDAAAVRTLRQRETTIADDLLLAELAALRAELADLDAQLAAARDEAERCRLAAADLLTAAQAAARHAAQAEVDYRTMVQQGSSAVLRSETLSQRQAALRARLQQRTQATLAAIA